MPGPQHDELTAHRVGLADPTGRASRALRELLAFMASSDGQVHPQELDLLRRLLPGADPREIEGFLQTHAQPDLERLASEITEVEDRWAALRFAARMAWRDGRLEDAERGLLEQLAELFHLPEGAVGRVLHEMQPLRRQRLEPPELLALIQEPQWDSVLLVRGALVSEDLRLVLPPDEEVVVRVGVDRVEVLALCTGGVAGRFLEGAAFVPWSQMVSYSRNPSLDVSLRLHTEDGALFSLVDSRLGGLALILDRLLAGRPDRSP